MEDVLAIAAEAEVADGVAPLDEATLLTLRHRPETVHSVVTPAGFALLIGDEVSVVVRPPSRSQGVGSRLLTDLLDGVRRPLTGWSHGTSPAAGALAAAHGFRPVRELWVMRRPAGGLPPLPAPPAGVSVRGFRPGDEAELLRVNASAFAHHPEQGSLSLAGLRERMAEPWFEADGLIQAWEVSTGSTGGDRSTGGEVGRGEEVSTGSTGGDRSTGEKVTPGGEVSTGSTGEGFTPGGERSRGERLLGFHWTKRHSPESGEVYVVGVDPAAQGRGLGKLLTLAGLHHLADVAEVHLYVEADNEPAVQLYSGLGFTHAAADTHIQYARP